MTFLPVILFPMQNGDIFQWLFYLWQYYHLPQGQYLAHFGRYFAPKGNFEVAPAAL